MNIKTEYEPRNPKGMRWTAIDSDTYDGPECPLGLGDTEDEAIAELLERLRPEDPKPN
jgi:hypothetical protein